jgi:lipopolysaccharide export LptBFGC system permease protein LptF
MSRNTWQLFSKHWVRPFAVTLAVLIALYTGYFFYSHYHHISAQQLSLPQLLKLLALVVLYAGIICLNAAVFFSAGIAGRRLARSWWQQPVKLFPRFLLIIGPLSLAAFFLTSFVRPAISLQQSKLLPQVITSPSDTLGLFSLYAAAKPLNRELAAPRKQLIDSVGKYMSWNQAYVITWLDTLKAIGISDKEVDWRYTGEFGYSRYGFYPPGTSALLDEIHRIQQQIDRNTLQRWRCYQQPIYLLLFFSLGLFLGTCFLRYPLWALLFFTSVIYYVYLLMISQGIENAAKKDRFAPWFVYLLPVCIILAACVILYFFLRTTFKPTSPVRRIRIR